MYWECVCYHFTAQCLLFYNSGFLAFWDPRAGISTCTYSFSIFILCLSVCLPTPSLPVAYVGKKGLLNPVPPSPYAYMDTLLSYFQVDGEPGLFLHMGKSLTKIYICSEKKCKGQTQSQFNSYTESHQN